MFVQSRLKTQGAALVALTTALTVGACSDNVANTDLRPDGPPEVLSVLVMNDPDTALYERATFCKEGDTKRPLLVGLPDFTTQQICDDDLTLPAGFHMIDPQTKVDTFVPSIVEDAVPTLWYTRVMFDELLDPTVEDLDPICVCNTFDATFPTCNDKMLGPITAPCTEPGTIESGTFNGTLVNTQPVILTCAGTAVAYSGYYNPGGNSVTWPLGPSLFIQPTDLTTVATGSECSVEIKDSVHDKTNIPVPAEQRGTGGVYKFKIAALAFVGSTPALADPGMEEEITADAPLVISFNGFIDVTTLKVADVTIKEGADCAAAAAGTAKVAVIADDGDGVSLDISIANPTIAGEAWNEAKAYQVTFSDTNAVADLAGGPGALPGAADFTLCFTTVAP